MYRGFPIPLFDLIKCPVDSKDLQIIDQSSVLQERLNRGRVKCTSCHKTFDVTDGILDLLEINGLNKESSNERIARDEWANKPEEPTIGDDMAIQTKLSLLSPHRGKLLEIGCGTGRFTTLLANQYEAIIGVDFSGESLRVLANRLNDQANVGLVQADISRFHVKPYTFDRTLSTLTSNLPTPELRAAMYRLAGSALTPKGRFVYSAHHYDFRRRFRKEPQGGHYPRSGIYRYHFTQSELIHEASEVFRNTRVVKRVLYLPSFLGRMGSLTTLLNRIAERTPGVSQLGELLVASSENPIDTIRK